jgi:2-polyprenyl-6-methoxyphenol hydroxylase-like FAD-dependent oxidoreductase
VWDSHGYVRYDASDAGEAVMGHVVENARLQAACLAAMQSAPGGAAADVRWPVSVKALQLPPYSSAKGSGSGHEAPQRYHPRLLEPC